MTNAVEIMIDRFTVGVKSQGYAWAGTQDVIDVAVPSLSQVQSQSGFIVVASSQNIIATNVIVESGLVTGSWLGNANTFNIIDLAPVMSGSNSGLVTGSLLGNANTFGVVVLPDEDHNTSLISADNPEANQSTSLVEWNHFPTTTFEVSVTTKPLDASRYKKAYSFSRQQPVRIRLFRR